MKKKIYHLVLLDEKETSLGYYPRKGDLKFPVDTIQSLYDEYADEAEFRIDIYRGRRIPKEGDKPISSVHTTGWW